MRTALDRVPGKSIGEGADQNKGLLIQRKEVELDETLIPPPILMLGSKGKRPGTL